MATMSSALSGFLMEVVNEFGRVRKLSRATIGIYAAHDSAFFHRVAEGQGFGVERFDKCVRYFQSEWPEGAKWPRPPQWPIDPPPAKRGPPNGTKKEGDADGGPKEARPPKGKRKGRAGVEPAGGEVA